jgi:hypothetical protein
MRPLLNCMAVVILVLTGCGGLNESMKSDELVGPIVRSQLSGAFLVAYDTVHVESMFIDLIRKAGSKVETKVFLGTWCSDSRRELPRFLKVIEQEEPRGRGNSLSCGARPNLRFLEGWEGNRTDCGKSADQHGSGYVEHFCRWIDSITAIGGDFGLVDIRQLFGYIFTIVLGMCLGKYQRLCRKRTSVQ